MNAKHGFGREILLSTAWSETLLSFLLHGPDRVQPGFLLFLLSPMQIEASNRIQGVLLSDIHPESAFIQCSFLLSNSFQGTVKGDEEQ